jgi:hypothetical protein
MFLARSSSKVVKRNQFHAELWLPWQPKGIKGLKVLLGRSFEHIDKGGKPIRLGFKWLGQVREVVNNITKH